MDIPAGKYNGFYIGHDVIDKDGTPRINIKESKEEWNIVVKNIPFKICPEIKNISSHTWYDQNGDDEYIPDQPRFKAYELPITFYCIAPHGQANVYIMSFFNFITGKRLYIYDQYSKIGLKDVRYVSYSEKAFKRREGQNDVVEFSMTFKVNDPVTNITLP